MHPWWQALGEGPEHHRSLPVSCHEEERGWHPGWVLAERKTIGWSPFPSTEAAQAGTAWETSSLELVI